MAQQRAPGTSLRTHRVAAMARGHLLVVPVHLHFFSEVFHEALKPYSFWGAENLQWRRRGSCRRQQTQSRVARSALGESGPALSQEARPRPRKNILTQVF